MAIVKNETNDTKEFWEFAKKMVREIEGWPDYKKEIVISAQGSGFKNPQTKSPNPKAKKQP